jgi:hypothetical protein
MFVKLINGENIRMKLTARGTIIGNGKDKLWMREIRELTKSGKSSFSKSTK